MADGPLIRGAAFTGLVPFSMMICFLLSLGSGTLVRYAQGRPWLCVLWSFCSLLAHFLGCKNLLQGVIALCFFGNELFQIEHLRDVLIQISTDEYPWTIVEILFRWYQDVNGMWSYQIRCLRFQCVNYPLKHTLIFNLACREIVWALCIQVSNSLHSLWKVWSQKVELCQLLSRKLRLVTFEKWSYYLCCLALSLPKQLSPLR